MKRINPRRQSGVLVSAAFFLLLLPHSAYPASDDLQLTPRSIKIGTFFGGSLLSVSAEIPPGCDAVIEISGKAVEEDLMRKGRRWALCMNTGEIDVQGVPCLYYVMSSDPELLSATRRDRPWGYDALRKAVSFRGQLKDGEAPKLFREFVRLKEGERLYGMFPGALKIFSCGQNQCTAQGDFRFSTRVSPGTYNACLSVIKNGQVVQHRCASLDVVMVGAPAFLSALACEHSLLYGFLAVALAATAGFLSGLVFRPRRKGAKEKDKC